MIHHVLRHLLAFALAAIAFAPASASAQADNFPSRAVTVVVPFPPGGSTDAAARQLATRLSALWSVPVIVVNKPGGGSAVGSSFVADAKPDGYTLLFTSSALITSQYIQEGAPAVGSFRLAGIVAESAPLLVVGAESKIETVADFARAAASRSVAMGLQPGASQHITTERLLQAIGERALLVPFKGQGEAMLALAGGHIEANIAPLAAVRPFIESGKVRPIAVASRTRLRELPAVPTFREQKVELVASLFEGLFAPKATPAAVLDSLDAALRRIAQDPALSEALRSAGLVPVFLPGAAGERRIALEDREMLDAMRRLGIAKHTPVVRD